MQHYQKRSRSLAYAKRNEYKFNQDIEKLELLDAIDVPRPHANDRLPRNRHSSAPNYSAAKVTTYNNGPSAANTNRRHPMSHCPNLSHHTSSSNNPFDDARATAAKKKRPMPYYATLSHHASNNSNSDTPISASSSSENSTTTQYRGCCPLWSGVKGNILRVMTSR